MIFVLFLFYFRFFAKIHFWQNETQDAINIPLIFYGQFAWRNSSGINL